MKKLDLCLLVSVIFALLLIPLCIAGVAPSAKNTTNVTKMNVSIKNTYIKNGSANISGPYYSGFSLVNSPVSDIVPVFRGETGNPGPDISNSGGEDRNLVINNGGLPVSDISGAGKSGGGETFTLFDNEGSTPLPEIGRSVNTGETGITSLPVVNKGPGPTVSTFFDTEQNSPQLTHLDINSELSAHPTNSADNTNCIGSTNFACKLETTCINDKYKGQMCEIFQSCDINKNKTSCDTKNSATCRLYCRIFQNDPLCKSVDDNNYVMANPGLIPSNNICKDPSSQTCKSYCAANPSKIGCKMHIFANQTPVTVKPSPPPVTVKPSPSPVTMNPTEAPVAKS